MGNPARFTSGVTNNPTTNIMRALPVLDPTKVHTYFNDFDKYDAADWTITTTEAGGGDATEALADADGGVLVITNDAADNDLDFIQKKGESFMFVTGKKLWFKARFKIFEVIQCDAKIGLIITDTTLLDVTDGVYFGTDDGDALLDFGVEKNNVATAVTGIKTLVADTYLEVAFYYDGKAGIEYAIDGVIKGTAALTNLPDDEELTVTFGIQNGEAVANVLSLDYILVAKER